MLTFPIQETRLGTLGRVVDTAPYQGQAWDGIPFLLSRGTLCPGGAVVRLELEKIGYTESANEPANARGLVSV